MIIIINFIVSLTGLIFLYYLVYSKTDIKNNKQITISILSGIICAIFVIIIKIISKIFIITSNPFYEALLEAYVYNGIIFEIIKYIIFINIIVKDNNSLNDIIIFYILISSVFFTYENILYATGTPGIIRIILYIPAQIMIYSVSGFFISKGREKDKKLLSAAGIITGIIYHGTYNFLLFSGNKDSENKYIMYAVFFLVIIFIVHFGLIYRKTEIYKMIKKGKK